jgi:hypothetical protein
LLCGPACDGPSACLTRVASCWLSDEIRRSSASVAGSKRPHRSGETLDPIPSPSLSLHSLSDAGDRRLEELLALFSLSLFRVWRLPARRSGAGRRPASALFHPPVAARFGRGDCHQPEPRRRPATRSTAVDGGTNFAPGGVLPFRPWRRLAPLLPVYFVRCFGFPIRTGIERNECGRRRRRTIPVSSRHHR